MGPGGPPARQKPIGSGGRFNTSEIFLNGAESRNSTTNDITYTPPLEAVQEFKVIVNSFSSEYGRSGGGVLTAATRSGTNELHGSLYELLRNDKLNANSWTSNRQGLPRSPLRRNEYGFAISKPVIMPKTYNGRDRTFFFVNWEQIPQRSPDNINTTVPTAAERGGDFSETVDGAGRLIRIYDPLTTRAEPNVRTPNIKTFDIGLSRIQRIGERVGLQFRAEFFNAFNTPEFGTPNESLTPVDFGRIATAGGARNIQLSLRLSY